MFFHTASPSGIFSIQDVLFYIMSHSNLFLFLLFYLRLEIKVMHIPAHTIYHEVVQVVQYHGLFFW